MVNLLRTLNASDYRILDGCLDHPEPMNCREMAAVMPLAYDTLVKRLRVMYPLGLFIKVEYGRYKLNDSHPAVNLFNRIRCINYTPPIPPRKDGLPVDGHVRFPEMEKEWHPGHAKVIDV